MSAPRLLVDNDALLKAAHWGLLDVVPSLVSGVWSDVACLPQFPPRVRRAEAKLFADASVALSLAARLSQTIELPEPDANVLSVLQIEPGIDAGELLLFGALVATPQAILLTGDKRALRAISQTDIRSLCRGRIVCVEQLLLQALYRLGAPTLVAQVRQWEQRDKTALAIFSRSGDKSDADIREGLNSYLRALDGEAPGLLVRGFGL
jgi:hypothetical protein